MSRHELTPLISLHKMKFCICLWKCAVLAISRPGQMSSLHMREPWPPWSQYTYKNSVSNYYIQYILSRMLLNRWGIFKFSSFLSCKIYGRYGVEFLYIFTINFKMKIKTMTINNDYSKFEIDYSQFKTAF